MKYITKGNTAEIFEYGDGLICKLFNCGYPKTYIEHEYENAKVVNKIGLRTPLAHKMINVDSRNGIIYDRVVGETLSSEMFGKNGDEKTQCINNLVSLHKELLSHSINDVMNYKDFLKMFAGNSEKVIEKINKLEDGNSLLHGDFHLGNIMTDANKQLFVIDMMNICKGPAKYDIARTYYLLGSDTDMQTRYLDLMECDFQQIAPYLEVISLTRENEIKD